MATAPTKRRVKPAKLTTARLIAAVLYLRRSDKKQLESIEQQREALTKYAKQRGYDIIREYVEDGISGDATEKRYSFLQMLADAQNIGDFKVILCWNLKRFGRFASDEGGYYTFPLRKAGIRLVTKEEGEIDWATDGGRIVNTVRQEGAHKDLSTLSSDVLRGQINQAKKGSWVGSVPYGYKIKTHEPKAGEKPFKELVLGKLEHRRIVQRIFKEFTGIGTVERTMTNIANRLNADGIDSPGWGKKGHTNRWRFDTIQVMLANPAYIGTFVFNRFSRSKYSHYTNGETTKGARKGWNPESDWIVIAKHHEPIIQKSVFDKAKAKLEKGKTGQSPHTPETNPYLFNPALLRCGRCGERMWGMEVRVSEKHDPDNPNDPLMIRTVSYECGHRKYHTSCEGTVVREHEVLDAMVNHLRTEFNLPEEMGSELRAKAKAGKLTERDMPDGFKKLKRLLVGKLPKQADTRRIEKEVQRLESDITTARRNLVRIKDPKNIAAGEAEIESLERQLAESKVLLHNRPTEQDINQTTKDVLAKLGRLSWTNQPRMLKPAVREILSELDTIKVFTDKTGTGTATRHKLKRCEFRFKAVRAVTGKMNPYLPG